jgi:hypothetical protein
MCVAHSCYMFRPVSWPSSGVTSLVEGYSGYDFTKNTVSIWNLGTVRICLKTEEKKNCVEPAGYRTFRLHTFN